MSNIIMKKSFVSRETFLRKTAIAAVFCALCFALFSCGGVSYTDEELTEAATELVTKSFELNEIYFGEGLPISDSREDVERFYASFDSDVDAVNYHPVAEDCEYQSIADIKKATEEVFTAAYCEYLYELAFKGISSVMNEGTEQQFTTTASYARYIENGDALTVRLDVIYEAMDLTRTYDFSSMEIVTRKKNYAVVRIPTQKKGESTDVDLKLILTPTGFRLDTPTY